MSKGQLRLEACTCGNISRGHGNGTFQPQVKGSAIEHCTRIANDDEPRELMRRKSSASIPDEVIPATSDFAKVCAMVDSCCPFTTARAW